MNFREAYNNFLAAIFYFLMVFLSTFFLSFGVLSLFHFVFPDRFGISCHEPTLNAIASISILVSFYTFCQSPRKNSATIFVASLFLLRISCLYAIHPEKESLG